MKRRFGELFQFAWAAAIIMLVALVVVCLWEMQTQYEAKEEVEKHLEITKGELVRVSAHNDYLQSLVDGCSDRLEVVRGQVYKLKGTVSLLAKDVADEWNVMPAVVTAYSPLDDRNGINSQGDPTKTSIGMKVGYGRFAVDPARIPYGSRILIIYSDGSTEEGIAADTGGALRNASHIAIDVFRTTFDEAMRFGVNEATIVWQPPSE